MTATDRETDRARAAREQLQADYREHQASGCTCGKHMPDVIDAAHLKRQREWSARTFGPGRRTKGVVEHIRKELKEIEADPLDVTEWVDVVILALDGAWRAGAEPQQIIDAIKAKQARNEARSWPDWRTMSEDQAIEHVRESDEPCDDEIHSWRLFRPEQIDSYWIRCHKRGRHDEHEDADTGATWRDAVPLQDGGEQP